MCIRPSRPTWWGWGGLNNQNETSSIITILCGCGVGKLGFGDCSAKYGMKVHLNGNEIGMAARGEKKTIEFNFKDGDILKLTEYEYGVIQFNSFTILSCC